MPLHCCTPPTNTPMLLIFDPDRAHVLLLALTKLGVKMSRDSDMPWPAWISSGYLRAGCHNNTISSGGYRAPARTQAVT